MKMKETKICKSCSYFKRGNCLNPKVRLAFGPVNHICSISENFGCTLWAVNSHKFYANGVPMAEDGMSSTQAKKFLDKGLPKEKTKIRMKSNPRLTIYKEKP